MTTSTPKASSAPFLASVMFVAVALDLVAQVAPTPRPKETEEGRSRPEEILQLNAFEVQADSDLSYGALNSNSITRFSVDLNKMPVTADIFSRAFMDDVAATTVEDLIQNYSAGAGFSASDPGAVAANSQPGDRNANSYATLRGFYTPTIMRDGLMPTGAPATKVRPASA